MKKNRRDKGADENSADDNNALYAKVKNQKLERIDGFRKGTCSKWTNTACGDDDEYWCLIELQNIGYREGRRKTSGHREYLIHWHD